MATEHLRPLLRLAWLAWLAWLALLAMAAPAWAQPAPMKARAVADGVWFVQGLSALGSADNQNFISNAAFVVTPDGVLVIDALGSPPLARQLLALIREKTAQPVRYVVITHCHADHIYGLQEFKAVGATLVGHVGCRDYLNSDAARLRLQASREEMAPWIDDNTRLVAPDQWVGEGAGGGRSEDDVFLHLGPRRFRIQHAGPAHTDEDLVVLDEATGVLFAGDIVFRSRIPFVGQADSGRWVQALDRMLTLQPRLLVPGHGPVSSQPAQDLQLTRDYLLHLRQAMGGAARNLEPFEEAYARADWSRYKGLPLFNAANRINAYNTYLLMEREAK